MAFNIVISGLAGSGKTTLAKRLAKRYGMKMYTGSKFLEKFAKGLGIKLSKNWWDTEQGLDFLEKRKQNPVIDRYVDSVLIEKLKSGNVIITSWTLPYLNVDAIKIFLYASKEERAKRLAKRNSISVENANKIVDERDERNYDLYRKVYNFELGRDLNVFDLVVDSTNKSVDVVENEVVEFIERRIKRNVQKKKG